LHFASQHHVSLVTAGGPPLHAASVLCLDEVQHAVGLMQPLAHVSGNTLPILCKFGVRRSRHFKRIDPRCVSGIYSVNQELSGYSQRIEPEAGDSIKLKPSSITRNIIPQHVLWNLAISICYNPYTSELSRTGSKEMCAWVTTTKN